MGCSLAQRLSPGLGRALYERGGCPVHHRIPAAHLELTRSAPPGPQGVRSRNQETRKRTCSEVSRRRPRGLAYKLRGPVRAITRRLRLGAQCTLLRGGQRGQGAVGRLVLTFRLLVSLRLPSAAGLTDLQSRARLRRHHGPPHRLAKGKGPLRPTPQQHPRCAPSTALAPGACSLKPGRGEGDCGHAPGEGASPGTHGDQHTQAGPGRPATVCLQC